MVQLEVRLYGSPRLKRGDCYSFRIDQFRRLAIVHKGGNNNGSIVFRPDGTIEFRNDTASAGDPSHVHGRFEFVDDLDAASNDDSERRLRRFQVWAGGAMRITPAIATDSINCSGHLYRYAEIVAAEEGE